MKKYEKATVFDIVKLFFKMCHAKCYHDAPTFLSWIVQEDKIRAIVHTLPSESSSRLAGQYRVYVT